MAKTLTDQVADALRAAIYDGQYAAGAQLPTEADLMEEYEVSRNTVRAALARLANEGLTTATPRKGTFVRSKRLRRFHPQDEFVERAQNPAKDAFLTELEGRHAGQSIEVGIVSPPADVARNLGLGRSGLTAVRRKVRFLDGEPFEISDAFFPYELVQGTDIMLPEDIARGAGRVLVEQGHRQMRFQDEITSRMPNPEESERLALGPGTPVTVHSRTAYDQDDQPVRVLLTILPSDKHVIVYDLTRPE
ncbi:GntR family transcriptional regulator [Streptomyces sp. NPDC050523]|uniref:GntR family transcriptional regulator n=1 Tax=Streptomyces sp. NPDC050523 TaxID=3365622 RepID=UPI0037AAA868